MICALFEPIDVKVFVEINNLVVNCKGESAGSTSVAALSWADFSTMKSGEKLFLCGHGDTDDVGGRNQYYDPDALAQMLVDQGLPAHIKSIRMLTCESGTSVNDMANQAYCVRLANAITQLAGFTIPVLGFRGAQVTNQYGQTRGVKDAVPGHLQGGYDAIINTWGQQLAVWELAAQHWPTNSAQEIIDGAAKMARMSKPMFAALYAHNAQIVRSKADSKHWS